MNSEYDYRAYTILFVDDEPQALKYFQKAFGAAFRTSTCSSAKDAWRYIDEHADEIGIVISDQRMPGERGVDLLATVKSQYPHIVRILTTAYSDLDSAVDSVNRGGAFAYVNKPWELDGLEGTLKRAMEFFLIRRERDRLVGEKLGALQRMLVMDRVRGLATLAALLKGRLRDPGGALVNYVRQANLKKQIVARADALAEMDMMTAAREECEQLIHALQVILADVAFDAGHADEMLDLRDILREYLRKEQTRKAADGVAIEMNLDATLPLLRGNAVLLSRLISILIERISDMDSDDSTIRVYVESLSDERIRLLLTADAVPWVNGKVASLYSALVPFREWPMGVDMDILSAFLIAHHHGGSIELVNEASFGPGFRVTLALSPVAKQDEQIDRRWLDEVFRSMELWRSASC
jgi:two-component system, probable response regulator PhcQ